MVTEIATEIPQAQVEIAFLGKEIDACFSCGLEINLEPDFTDLTYVEHRP